MPRNNIKLSLLTLLLPLAAAGQAGFYVPPGATVYSFGNTSIFGDVQNYGSLGSVTGDTVLFYGTNWFNAPGATMPTVGTGGVFRFIQPRPAPYAGSVTQNLNGGYSGSSDPAFPNLDVNNPNNVNMTGTGTRVKNNLNFTSGKIVLNTNDLVLGSPAGNGGTGTITNYDQNRYAVTNVSANTGGHLVKESYTGAYTFPVGVSASSYSPAKVTNASANGIHVNVGTYAAYSAAPRTSNDGVDRTWNIYGDAAGNSNIDLQHDTSTNQVLFRKASHFVARYVGTAPNTAGDQISFDAWERNTPGPGSATGTLTTSAPIVTATERDRSYAALATSATANSAYYTKASGPVCINARAYVEGSLLNNGGAIASDGRPLMRDNLRNSPFTGANYIPVKDPYEFATTNVNVTGKYTKLAPQNSSFPYFRQVSDSATVFGVSGQNAVVDWVFVELRNKSNSSSVLATRAALIQRDGDVVEVDGKACLSFPGLAVDSYYVALRHRSHLGVMTKFPQSTTQLESLVNFTDVATPLFDKGIVGTNNFTGLATNNNVKSGYRAMWQGDFNADGKVKYDNPNDDLGVMLAEVVNYPTNTDLATNFDFAYGYFQGDYDMNSKDKYDNPNDDNTRLLSQVVNYPQNVDLATNYDFLIQQLP